MRNVEPEIPLHNDIPVTSESIFIKSGYRNIKLNIDGILYLESVKDYVKIYTQDGMITMKGRISDMEVSLSG